MSVTILRAFLQFILLSTIGFSAQGAVLTETWTSVRALGMGNAYTSVVSNADALFYNPAGLCKAKGFTLTLANPRVGTDALDIMTQMNNYRSSSHLAAYLDTLYGKNYWFGGGGMGSIVLPCFGFGIFAGADLNASLDNPANPTWNLTYLADYGYAAGFGFDLIPSLMTMGINLRRINRTGTDHAIGPDVLGTGDTTAISDQLKNRGWGWGADIGVNLSLPTPIRPTVSAVWKNAGVTTFSHDEGTAAPPVQLDEMVAGASLEIAPLPLFSLIPSADFKYLNRPDVQIGKKIHVGLEMNILMISARFGFNQGYYTWGAGLDLGILHADFASYGVELGEYPGQIEDRRYLAQLTIEFAFDGSSFGGGGSKDANGGTSQKRPKLKARR